MPLTEDQIWRILGDLTQGLYHIHSKGIAHLDMKPGNIFISENGILKIGDFGLAAVPPIVNSDRDGDRAYLAPECLHEPSVSYPADIYRFLSIINFSLGLILLEMSANIILPENGPIWQQLRDGNLDGIVFSRHSQMLVDVIKSMLNRNPAMRPTASNLLSHPKLAAYV